MADFICICMIDLPDVSVWVWPRRC